MAGALPTKPPRQLSGLSTNPGSDRQCKTTKQVNTNYNVHVRVAMQTLNCLIAWRKSFACKLHVGRDYQGSYMYNVHVHHTIV